MSLVVPTDPTTWTEAYLQSWQTYLRAGNRSESTVKSYMLAATQLERYITTTDKRTDPVDVRPEQIQRYIAHVADTRASATAGNRYRSHFRQYVRSTGGAYVPLWVGGSVVASVN